MNDEMVYTIEYIREGWWVCQHGIYPPSSVLAGQEYRQLMRSYATPEEAKVDFPYAEILSDEWKPLPAYIPKEPPDWFDPLAAGEAWGEDDY